VVVMWMHCFIPKKNLQKKAPIVAIMTLGDAVIETLQQFSSSNFPDLFLNLITSFIKLLKTKLLFSFEFLLYY